MIPQKFRSIAGGYSSFGVVLFVLMLISVLSWNVWGLGCKEKRATIKDMGSCSQAMVVLF